MDPLKVQRHLERVARGLLHHGIPVERGKMTSEKCFWAGSEIAVVVFNEDPIPLMMISSVSALYVLGNLQLSVNLYLERIDVRKPA